MTDRRARPPAVILLSLACPDIGNAKPLPDIPDIPEIDETCVELRPRPSTRDLSILDYRFAQANPAIYPIESIITEVATRGNFNYETAGFVVGAAMASSCPHNIDPFEAALGEEIA